MISEKTYEQMQDELSNCEMCGTLLDPDTTSGERNLQLVCGALIIADMVLDYEEKYLLACQVGGTEPKSETDYLEWRIGKIQEEVWLRLKDRGIIQEIENQYGAEQI